MKDVELYNLLRTLSQDDDKVAHAYALIRQERDERLKIGKHDLLKGIIAIFLCCTFVYLGMYFLMPTPCK
jgi:hypothetical protein